MSVTTSRGRLVLGVVVAAVVLGAVSTAALGTLTGAFRGRSSSPNGRCSAPALRGTVVDVTLLNMGGPMMGGGRVGPMGGTMRVHADRSQVAAGTVSFRVANVGSIVHELVVLPLLEGRHPGGRQIGLDGKVDETGSIVEASRSCGPGAGDGIGPGSLGWATVRLPAGNYELICNLPGHYASGMYTELRVR